MKNFIGFLIILIFGAFVFFVGWTQIKVKPGSIGIVQSKTSGISSKIIIPGHFSWHKEFLIPTNAQIEKFEYKPYNGTKTISGKRGSGDFSFTFQISLSYEPELIADLLQDNKISNQEDFESYLEGVASYLAQRAADYLITKFYQTPYFSPQSVTISELVSAIAFYKDYPDFDINVLAITDYTFNSSEAVL
ncbi:MAG: hypothetical protein J5710_12895 [Treponema sp.]|nr:hypothetical protein [Treponema sp.]